MHPPPQSASRRPGGLSGSASAASRPAGPGPRRGVPPPPSPPGRAGPSRPGPRPPSSGRPRSPTAARSAAVRPGSRDTERRRPPGTRCGRRRGIPRGWRTPPGASATAAPRPAPPPSATPRRPREPGSSRAPRGLRLFLAHARLDQLLQQRPVAVARVGTRRRAQQGNRLALGDQVRQLVEQLLRGGGLHLLKEALAVLLPGDRRAGLAVIVRVQFLARRQVAAPG